MSLVQVAPLLALLAKGLLSVAACGAHVPSRLVSTPVRVLHLPRSAGRRGVDQVAATGSGNVSEPGGWIFTPDAARPTHPEQRVFTVEGAAVGLLGRSTHLQIERF